MTSRLAAIPSKSPPDSATDSILEDTGDSMRTCTHTLAHRGGEGAAVDSKLVHGPVEVGVDVPVGGTEQVADEVHPV